VISITIIANLIRKLTPLTRRLSILSSSGWRLLTIAALMHIALATGLFWAGRAQIAPSFIDRDGIMGSFAFDSYEYRSGALRLVDVFRQDGIRAWATEKEPIHVRLLSIQFVLLGTFFGQSTLSAEPLNLVFYLIILILVFALGREVAGRRAGLIAAVTVALWPTFVLHTTQFLKDPFFIAGALAFVLCLTTWLTRIYNRRAAISIGAVMVVNILILLLIRLNFGVFIFALVFFGFVLLISRQFLTRRLLYWNMLCPLMAMLTLGMIIPFYMTQPRQIFKQYPSDQGGQPKSVAIVGLKQMPTIISYHPQAHLQKGVARNYAEKLRVALDEVVFKINSVRSRFATSYPDGGSGLDSNVEFKDFRDIVLYLPRALEIGFFAPFPNMWMATGKRVGNAGRLLSGVETLIIYLCELLALFALLRAPRDLALWLLWAIITFGVTALVLAVPNIGTLYRFRYTFWILLIILGMKGIEELIALVQKRLRALKPLEAN
jgi:hypothetical protein